MSGCVATATRSCDHGGKRRGRVAVDTPPAAVHACSHPSSGGVQVVLRNLLLADWFDEGHKESILHPGRSKYAAELLSNMRLACSVAGQATIEVRGHPEHMHACVLVLGACVGCGSSVWRCAPGPRSLMRWFVCDNMFAAAHAAGPGDRRRAPTRAPHLLM